MASGAYARTNALTDAEIFQDITEDEIERMLICLNARTERCAAGDTVRTYRRGASDVGILKSGALALERMEPDGGRTLLEALAPGGIFGEVLAFSGLSREGMLVVARAPSEIVFIDYAHIIKRCEKACDHHSLLVRNVLRLVADKTVHLGERIEVLSCRSIREKLLQCFGLFAARAGKNTFTLPFSYSELADYICADRSAMMRELGNMRTSGLLSTDGRRVTLLEH